MVTHTAKHIPEPQPRETWWQYAARLHGSGFTLAQLSAVYLWSQGRTIGSIQ